MERIEESLKARRLRTQIALRQGEKHAVLAAADEFAVRQQHGTAGTEIRIACPVIVRGRRLIVRRHRQRFSVAVQFDERIAEHGEARVYVVSGLVEDRAVIAAGETVAGRPYTHSALAVALRVCERAGGREVGRTEAQDPTSVGLGAGTSGVARIGPVTEIDHAVLQKQRRALALTCVVEYEAMHRIGRFDLTVAQVVAGLDVERMQVIVAHAVLVVLVARDDVHDAGAHVDHRRAGNADDRRHRLSADVPDVRRPERSAPEPFCRFRERDQIAVVVVSVHACRGVGGDVVGIECVDDVRRGRGKDHVSDLVLDIHAMHVKRLRQQRPQHVAIVEQAEIRTADRTRR